MPKRNNQIACTCCGSTMVIHGCSHEYFFYHCRQCGFWTTRVTDGFPTHIYDDEPAFLGEDGDRNGLVLEAYSIMNHKIGLINQLLTKNGLPRLSANKGRFLDIGCSEGLYVEAAQRMGFESYGFEVDSKKVRRASQKGLSVQMPNYNNFSQNSFDFIMSRHVLEHIPDFEEVLKAGMDLLKTGGGVLCGNP